MFFICKLFKIAFFSFILVFLFHRYFIHFVCLDGCNFLITQVQFIKKYWLQEDRKTLCKYIISNMKLLFCRIVIGLTSLKRHCIRTDSLHDMHDQIVCIWRKVVSLYFWQTYLYSGIGSHIVIQQVLHYSSLLLIETNFQFFDKVFLSTKQLLSDLYIVIPFCSAFVCFWL